MILSIDQSLTKIGYSFIEYPSNYTDELISYFKIFSDYQEILNTKEQQIIQLAKKNVELTIDILKSKIKWTKKQSMDLENYYNSLNLFQKELINKYSYNKYIETSFKTKQIRNVVKDFPFKNIDPVYGLIETDDKNISRLYYYQKEFLKLIEKHSPKIIIIEGYSYGSSNTRSVFELGELAGMMKLIAFSKGIPLIIVPPSTLKLFISDDGTAQKEDMIKNVKEKFNKEFFFNKKLSDDITDSYCLNVLGSMFPFLHIDFQIKNKIIINKE